MKEKRSTPPMEETAMEPERINTTEFPTVIAVEPEYDGSTYAPPVRHKKRFSFFRKRTDEVPEEENISASLVFEALLRPAAVNDVEENEEAEAAEQPVAEPAGDAVGDTAEIVLEKPLTKAAEDTAEIAITKVIGEEEDTVKVYGGAADDTREVMQQTRVIDDEDDDTAGTEQATQLMLDGFDNEEEEAEGAGEALKRIRQEKIQDFSQKREEHARAVAEQENQSEEEAEEVTEPTEEPVVEAPVPAPIPKEEFTSHQQLGAIRQKLQAARRSAGLSLFVTAVIEAILFFVALLSYTSPVLSVGASAYLVMHLIFFGVLIAVSWKHLKNGLQSLLEGTVTANGAVALAAILTVVHTVLLFIDPVGIEEGSVPLLPAVTGFSMLLMQVAAKLEADRITRTFGLVAAQGEKWMAKRIEDGNLAEEIGRPAVAIGEPRVTYFRKTEFAADYLQNTDDTRREHAWMRWYLPVAAGLSLIAAVVFLILNGVHTWILAVTLFCAVFCVASPIFMTLFFRATMTVSDSSLYKTGTAIVGDRAVQEFGASHAVALDAIDLFPEKTVLLHGIKTFSGTRIDEAILDAASVSIRAGGPLSHVFRRMILNKVDMLHEVDTLVYEQDMGLSGWVSGRRVLIGNRKLLDNHGIDIPSKDYEERYAKNGRQLVYLSIAGELSAMFVVSYVADPSVKRMLTTLTNRHITLLVRTCDPNITENLIASTFGLNGFYVEVLSAPAGRSYENLVEGVSERESVGIVSVRGVGDMLNALAQCRLLRFGTRFFTVLQAVIGAFGVALTTYMAFAGALIHPFQAILFLLVATVISLISAFAFSKS